MLNGVILLWFVLAALAVALVAIDISNTPESPVLKWGFVLLTAYTGVVGAFLYVIGCREPLLRTGNARFWFVMSMALLIGFIIAYPMNWWLVANHLKHGMMTVRPKKEARMAMPMGSDGAMATGGEMAGMAMEGADKPSPSVPIMTVLSFVALAAGLALAFTG